MKPSSLPDSSYATRRVHAEATDLFRWLGYKLIGIALATAGSFLVPGAVAGLGFGAICTRSVAEEGATLGEWFKTSADVCHAISSFGWACALTAIGILTVWILSRGWPRPLSSESTSEDPAHEQSAIGLALGLALAVVPLLIVMSARPAIAFVIGNLHLLRQPLDGIVLMVPLLQLTIAGAWLLAGIGICLLFLAKDRLFPRTFLVALPAQLGLLAASHQVLTATRLVTVPVATEIPMAVEHAAAITNVVHGLGWAFAAYAVMAPFVLFSRAVRTRCADRSLNHEEEMAATTPPSAPVESRGRAEEDDRAAGGFGRPRVIREGALGDRFHIQATYVGGFFGAWLQIQDLDSGHALAARGAPLRLRGLIRVHFKRQPEKDLFRIEVRRALSIGGPYDVIDSRSNALLAVIRKRLAGSWEIHDPQDQLIGMVTRGEWGMSHAADQVVIGSHEVGSLHWSNILKPALEVDCSMDADQLLDRRVGLALGILLFLNRSIPTA